MLRLLKSLFKPALGLIILFILIKNGMVDLRVIGSALVRHPWLILAAALLQFGLATVAGWRWYLLLSAGGLRLPFRRVFSLHMIGIFFVTLIPGGTGGDLVKGYYLYKGVDEKKDIAISSIVVDRIVGLYILLLWGCLGSLLNFRIIMGSTELRAYFFFYLALFGGCTLLLVLCFTPLVRDLFTNNFFQKLPGQKLILGWNAAFHLYRKQKGTLWICALLTLAVHGFIIVVYGLCTWGLDVGVSLWQQSLVVPMMTLINGLPIAPGGIGVGEAGGEFLYRFLDVSQGGEILVLFHLIFFINALAGAPFYFLHRSRR